MFSPLVDKGNWNLLSLWRKLKSAIDNYWAMNTFREYHAALGDRDGSLLRL
ncbi:MAG: hypothetical protein QXU99_04855 [Candidatus Bathyarchaeia archaeon]